MYPLGLLSILQVWLPDDALVVKLCIALPGVVLLLLLFSCTRDGREDEGEAMSLPLSSVSTVLPFFRSRSDFISRGFQLTGRAIFQFNLLQVSAPWFLGHESSADHRVYRIPSLWFPENQADGISFPVEDWTSMRVSRFCRER